MRRGTETWQGASAGGIVANIVLVVLGHATGPPVVVLVAVVAAAAQRPGIGTHIASEGWIRIYYTLLGSVSLYIVNKHRVG